MKIAKIAVIILMSNVALTTFSTTNPILVYQIRKSRPDLLDNTIIPQ